MFAKANQFCVVIFWFFFIDSRHIPKIPIEMIGSFREVLDFDWLFLKLNWLICN